MKGGSDEQAQKEAVTETAAALGLSQPLAQWALLVPQAFGMSLNMTGRRDESVFNLLHRLCAADLAGLWSAEVQPK